MEQSGVDLYWLPLEAGGWFVRRSGKVYEALVASFERRPRLALYHSALIVALPEGRFVIESAPIPDNDGPASGVVSEGAVGLRSLGQCASSATSCVAGATASFPTSPRRWTAPGD